LHKNSLFAEARTRVRAPKRPCLRPYFVRASAFFRIFSNFCAKPSVIKKLLVAKTPLFETNKILFFNHTFAAAANVWLVPK
jgi:hypothetical protein